MPRFDANLSTVSAGIPLLDKDSYGFTVGEPKAFYRKNNDGVESYGVQYQIRCRKPGKYENTPQFVQINWANDTARGIGKQFAMAVLGFNPRDNADEKAFDAQYGNEDWSFDTDSGAVGDFWRLLTGKRVSADVDVYLDKNGVERNRMNWRKFDGLD